MGFPLPASGIRLDGAYRPQPSLPHDPGPVGPPLQTLDHQDPPVQTLDKQEPIPDPEQTGPPIQTLDKQDPRST
ncbi:unnamed protein product [Merluccius merluccius]